MRLLGVGRQIPIILRDFPTGCATCGGPLDCGGGDTFCETCEIFRCVDCGFWRALDDGGGDFLHCNACWYDEFKTRRSARRRLARDLRVRRMRRAAICKLEEKP